MVLVRPLGGLNWHEVTRFLMPFDGVLRVAAELDSMTFAEGEVGYGVSASGDHLAPCVSMFTQRQVIQPIDSVSVEVDLTAKFEGGAFNFGAMLGIGGRFGLTARYHQMIAALPAIVDVLPMPAPPAPAPMPKAATRKRTSAKPARKRRG